jgi:hypothetical protein
VLGLPPCVVVAQGDTVERRRELASGWPPSTVRPGGAAGSGPGRGASAGDLFVACEHAARCDLAGSCPGGLPAAYVQRFGTSELVPWNGSQ